MSCFGKLAFERRAAGHPSSSRAFATTLASFAAAAIATTTATALASDFVIRPNDPNETFQKITGFGASSAFTGNVMTPADADLLFRSDTGVGFTLLRIRIVPQSDPSYLTASPPCSTVPAAKFTELTAAMLAQQRGATVWAAPWTPPVAWKTNGELANGGDGGAVNGALDPDHADDWAQCLVSFVQIMNAQSPPIPIAYLSAENEPNVMAVGYEACNYTAPALTDFIANHLGPALTAAKAQDSSIATTIMAPETQGWDGLGPYDLSLLQSSAAMNVIGVFASHAYSGTPVETALPAGKELWETEFYDQGTNGDDPGMKSALVIAGAMHAALVGANVTAWHHWWIYTSGDPNEGLFDPTSGQPTKRLYAMSNFSKFVRPGYVRIGADPNTTDGSGTPGVLTSAYVDPTGKTLVVVAINTNTAPTPQRYFIDGVNTGSWVSWETSATANATTQGPAIDNSAAPGELDVTLDAESVTTFVGTVTGPGAAAPPPTAPPDASVPATGVASGSSASSLTEHGSSSNVACTTTGRSAGAGGRWGFAGIGGAAVGLLAASALVRRRRRRPSSRATP